MGAHFSTNANSIHVAVQKTTYVGGETLTGKVLINCVEACKADCLVLKLEGHEHTKWEDELDDDETCEGNRYFFTAKVKLASFEGQNLQPGQYEYGFNCVLPRDLPPTFDLAIHKLGCNDYKARISYTVEAELEVPGLLRPNLRHTCSLQVQHPLTHAPKQHIIQDTQQVDKCCCINKGSASLTAQVEKDRFTPGQVVNIIIQVVNKSSVDFSHVEATLVNYVHLRASFGDSTRIQQLLASATAAGVAADEVQAGAGARRLSIKLPAHLPRSVHSSLIDCKYCVEVRCKAPVCISDLAVQVPVKVYTASPTTPHQTQPPPDWNPGVVVAGIPIHLPAPPPCAPLPQQMVATGVPVRSSRQGSAAAGMPVPL